MWNLKALGGKKYRHSTGRARVRRTRTRGTPYARAYDNRPARTVRDIPAQGLPFAVALEVANRTGAPFGVPEEEEEEEEEGRRRANPDHIQSGGFLPVSLSFLTAPEPPETRRKGEKRD